ncbi:ATP-binding protein [Runella sp.]|uniref:ATP-binding protein n=1 Tax=Runella sp. TaxID=1960881 RepID=UPI003D0BFC07
MNRIFTFAGRTVMPAKRKYKLIISFLLLLIGVTSAAVAQKKVSDFFNLKGQARLDSLEHYSASVLQKKDSIGEMTEFNAIQSYADKTQDRFLILFVEFLHIRYHAFGNLRNQEYRYRSLKAVQEKLKQLEPSPLTERLNADIEFALGNILYDQRANSVTLINHCLSADLVYRKFGYQNILFAYYKLARLGLYYMNQVSDFETALRYFKEAERYVGKDPVDKYLIEFYKNYANCLVELKQYAQAIKYNKLAIAHVHEKRDSLKIGTINGNIAEIILNTFPNPVQAEPYFHQELVYRMKYKPHGLGDIAKVYGNLCQVAGVKKNREEVIRYFNKAIHTLESDPDKRDYQALVASLYKNRMIADTLLGDYKSAFKHERVYFEALIASNAQDLKEVTSEASVRFDVERNKLQAELANQQAQNFRSGIILISLLLVIAVIGGYFLYYRQRVRKEELARQLSFEQKEAERLAELDTLKTRFFANISHEFRTPLTLLVGPLADFQKKYPAEGMIPLMQRNLSRLQILINQLLDLSKLEAGKMEPVIYYGDLPQFLNYLFASFESLAQTKSIIFQRSQSHTNLMGYYDEDKLEKIISNLLSNAFKFTPPNGRIAIRVDYVPAKESKGGAMMNLTVTDTGIGIDAERLPRIFDRFYQVDDSQRRHYEGTGIGLALVKELVTALHGTITVESEPNLGSTFVLQLPCDQAHWGAYVTAHEPMTSPAKILRQSIMEETPVTSPEVITAELPLLLIVEDNPDLRAYVRGIFEGSYQIHEARDGQEGLEKAMELVPDIVICDLMMPRLDGFGFCKSLKTDMRTNHIPVVMLTAKATLEDRLEGLELGADEYLSKPFNTEELQVRVRNLVQQRQALRQKYAQPLGMNVTDSVKEESKEPTIDDRFLAKANAIIERFLAESQFGVEAFAAEMGMTSVQLRRKLKALTDQTVTEYIRNYRLEKAAELLRKKEGTVSEIAYRVGFESLSYFSKMFVEKYGKNASEWG